NRKKWSYEELEELLNDPDSVTHQVLDQYRDLLAKRKKHQAFAPHASQKTFNLGNNLFAIQRASADGGERILVLSNITRRNIIVEQNFAHILEKKNEGYYDVISESSVAQNGVLQLG